MGIMTRSLRFLAVAFALTAMLFAQLAVAAYACPVLGASLQSATPASGASAAAEDCCERPATDGEQPALCHAHCQPGAQAFEKPAAAVPVQGPASTPVVALAVARQATLRLIPGVQKSLLLRATAPPVALRHCCLRI
jgi:hypothetical protein